MGRTVEREGSCTQVDVSGEHDAGGSLLFKVAPSPEKQMAV